jgi:hypothetical protein
MSRLGHMESVDLRTVWQSEGTHFTPWLAQPENLKLLGDAIEMELELEAQEQRVGPFRADILCKERSTNNWVLIENQIEPTDHCHLGQLMTYAAGLQAVTIVWVAGKVREEHRAALDWLNKITDQAFNFFGLEIELWRIDDSPVAPKFNVVCKPNDWSKTVQEGASDIERGAGGATAQLYLDYWTALRDSLRDGKSFIRSQKPTGQYWTGYAIGKSNFNLVAAGYRKDKKITASVIMLGAEAKRNYRALVAHKDALERAVGEPLSWEERPEGVESRVAVYLQNAEPADRADWPRQHAWLREKLEKLHRAFSPVIRSLSFADAEPSIVESHLSSAQNI